MVGDQCLKTVLFLRRLHTQKTKKKKKERTSRLIYYSLLHRDAKKGEKRKKPSPIVPWGKKKKK